MHNITKEITRGDILKCVDNLPHTLENLSIVFVNKYENNYTSYHMPSDYTITDNLPQTLKNLTLTDCTKNTLDSLIKIPWECVVKHIQ
jgi:hypothetical protein